MVKRENIMCLIGWLHIIKDIGKYQIQTINNYLVDLMEVNYKYFREMDN